MQVETTGSGPPIVMIHGAFSDGRIWERQCELRNEYTLHRLSLSGYYPHRTAGEATTAATQVEDVLAFLAKLDAKVALVGHSRGGRLAMEVSAKAPEVIDRLILIEPGGVATPGFYEGIMRGPAPLGDPRSAVAELVALGRPDEALKLYVDHGHGAGTWDSLPPWFQRMATDNAHTIGMMMRDSTVPLSRETAASVRSSTLLLLGSNSPCVFSETAAVLKEVMRCLTVVEIPSDHFMTLKAAEACNREIRRWLAKETADVR